MKELTEILKAYRNHCDETWSVATVVQTKGSSYRRTGARMLILPDGATIGSVSGGCLERDVILNARKVLKTGKTIRLTYDTTSEEDILLGVGLGCKGVVDILVEGVPAPPETPGWLRFVEDIFTNRQAGVIATVIRNEGTVKAETGDRVMLNWEGNLQGTIEEHLLRGKVVADMEEALRKRQSVTNRYELENGAAEVCIEVIEAPSPLVIFGAGYDAVPLVRLAKEVGFHVTVVDPRRAYASARRFPEADAVIATDPENLKGQLLLDDRTAVVVMSHNYLADQGWLKVLLPLGLRYIGLMGPRKRAEKMLQELWGEGVATTEEQLERLHNPVGLDIGAEGPEQIALAILGEIQAVIMGHTGGLLREKKESIHSPRHLELPHSPEIFQPAEALCLASA